MLRTLTTIALAMGLILPGPAAVAQTAAPERAEERERTEKQETFRKGSPAAGEQERIQDRTRTREETQARDASGEAAKHQYQYQHQKQEQVRGGQDAEVTLSGDELKDRDRDRLRDKDLDQLHDRDRDRIHDPAGIGPRPGGGRR